MCWHHLNFQSPWLLLRVFLGAPILSLEPHHIAHHHVAIALWLLLLLLAVALWLLLLLLFPTMSFNFSRPYPSFCYTIKKQFHVRSAVFLRVLLPQVLIQRCIILWLCFSKRYSSFITYFWEFFFNFVLDKAMIKGEFPLIITFLADYSMRNTFSEVVILSVLNLWKHTKIQFLMSLVRHIDCLDSCSEAVIYRYETWWFINTMKKKYCADILKL